MKWHIVTLQEASDFVEHDILHVRFHVTHCAGCAILFNKDTFYPDISVKSIYLHDTRRDVQDQVVEREQGWVCKVFFHVPHFVEQQSGVKNSLLLSLHFSNIYAKKNRQKSHPDSSRHYDFSGSWLSSRWFQWNDLTMSQPPTISALLLKPLLTAPCQRHRGPHHCGDPSPIPNNWADVCGFFKFPGSQRLWRVSKHGAFSIHWKALGLRPNDQSCHHETWLHLHFVDWNSRWSRQAHHNGNIRLKERPQKKEHVWSNERPFPLVVNAQPLVHPCFLWVHLLIITKWPWALTSIANFVSIVSCVSVVSWSSQSSRAHCPPKIFWKDSRSLLEKKNVFRESQLEHDRSEEICIQIDKDAQKDFTFWMMQIEYFRYRKNWWISLNKSGNTGPLRNRSDFNEALTTLNRLHQESGERRLRPVPFWKYQRGAHDN